MSIANKFPALAKAESWFHGLSQRDQLAVKLLSLAVAAFLIYAVIWLPIQGYLKKAQANAESRREEFAWMKANEKQARKVAKMFGGSQPQRVQGASLLSTVSSTAKKYKLDLQKFEPRGDQKVNVWLEKASFNQMMLWLDELSKKYSVQVEQISVDKTDVGGLVSARLSLSV